MQGSRRARRRSSPRPRRSGPGCGSPSPEQDERHRVVLDDALEGPALRPIVGELGHGETGVLHPGERRRAARRKTRRSPSWYGSGPQQHATDHAEDGGVRADTQRQGEDARRGCSRGCASACERRSGGPESGPSSSLSSRLVRTVRRAIPRQSASIAATSPKASTAAARAACGLYPASISSRVRMSRWNSISLRTSRATSGSEPDRSEESAHGAGEIRPVPRRAPRRPRGRSSPASDLGAELAPAGRAEPVVLGLTPRLGETPLLLQPPLALEPVERGIEGALLDGEGVLGGLPDPAADAVAVHRAPSSGP